MRTYAAVAAIAMAPAMAHADVMAFTGWEDTSADAVFGTFGNVSEFGYTSAPDPVYDGNHSMFMTEDPLSSTPNAVVAWVTGTCDYVTSGGHWGHIGIAVPNSEGENRGHHNRYIHCTRLDIERFLLRSRH